MAGSVEMIGLLVLGGTADTLENHADIGRFLLTFDRMPDRIPDRNNPIAQKKYH